MRSSRLLGPVPSLLLLSAVVAVVAAGFARGLWVDNLHNGLLAFSFGFVGVGVVLRRPAQPEGWLFLLAGGLEAVMFFGRQVGHEPVSQVDRWWGWLGVWPLALTLAAVTWCVLCFPEGRFLSPVWRRAAVGLAVVAAVLSLVSALWPVEYDSAGVASAAPFSLPGASAAGAWWRLVAHPFYLALQLLWLLAMVARWRASDRLVRGQLNVMLGAVATSAVALVVGLLVAGTPRAGVLTATLIPVAAGWAMEQASMAKVISQGAEAGRLTGLTPRENDVLDLMAQGLSNAAIGNRLHLSVKTIEPVVTSVFAKLGVPAGSDNNRRVLAVVEYLHPRPAQADRAQDVAHHPET